MKDKTLICTVGLPRSGKTTWALTQRAPIVSPDAIRLAIYGQRFWAPGEKMVWTQSWYMVQSLFLAGHKTVIVDATNTTIERRDSWRSSKWDMLFKVIETPCETCIMRAKDLGDDEIIPIIEKMEYEYQSLAPGEDRL